MLSVLKPKEPGPKPYIGVITVQGLGNIGFWGTEKSHHLLLRDEPHGLKALGFRARRVEYQAEPVCT